MAHAQFPIYIPSKARAAKCIAVKALLAGGVKAFYLVLEPGQRKEYEAALAKIPGGDAVKVLVLPRSNKGLAYVRRWIQKHAAANKPGSFHWQIDDDVTFLQRAGGKNVKCPAQHVLGNIERAVGKYSNVAIASPRHQAFAWTFDGKDAVSFNNQCCSCMLIKDVPGLHYRGNTIEDTDYSMQVLHKGLCTMLFNRLLINNPPAGKQAGGCTGEFHYGRVNELRQALTHRWNSVYPNAFKLVTTNDKGDLKVAPSHVWRTFTQRPA